MKTSTSFRVKKHSVILFVLCAFLHCGNTIKSNAQVLYGQTVFGGANNMGTLFEYNTLNATTTKRIDFNGANGVSPFGSMCLYNSKLYGMTMAGGVNNVGVIFEWNPDPAFNTFTKKVDFNLAIGRNPCGALSVFNSKIYGMTEFGGAFDQGVIFEWNPATNIYNKKIDLGLPLGATPHGNLVLFGNLFYGMTQMGGLNNAGVIFEWSPLTNIYTKKIDFDTFLGSQPMGSLTFYNGEFYGMTAQGGNFNDGVLFKWNPLTNMYSKLFDFRTHWGRTPLGSLTVQCGKLYGMTQAGGLNDQGVIFEYDLSNFAMVIKQDLNISSGYEPDGGLTYCNGLFYGMMHSGGVNNHGTTFSWNPNTNSLMLLVDMFMPTLGAAPHADMVLISGNNSPEIQVTGGMPLHTISDGDLNPDLSGNDYSYFGETSISGFQTRTFTIHNYGVSNLNISASNITGADALLFSLLPGIPTTISSGCSQTFRIQFTPAGAVGLKNAIVNISSNDLDEPITNFAIAGIGINAGTDKMYAHASFGGTTNGGTLIEYNFNNNILSKKVDHTTSNGIQPYGTLTLAGNLLYGMTKFGGSSGGGTIFQYDPVTNIYTKKIDLSLALGRYPHGQLKRFGTKFYGLTQGGGATSDGVIFEWNATTNAYTKKFDFSLADGRLPHGSMSLFNNKFYGITRNGGSGDDGVIFEWDPSTNLYIKKIELDINIGNYPTGNLTLLGNKFYGMTNMGGLYDQGVLFEYDPINNVYTKMLDLHHGTGNFPTGSLVALCNKLYGVTTSGGSNNMGVIFEYDISNNIFTKRIELNMQSGNAPFGTMTFRKEKFYGLTSQGGVFNNGTVFEWDPITNLFVKKADLQSTLTGEQAEYSEWTFVSTLNANAPKIKVMAGSPLLSISDGDILPDLSGADQTDFQQVGVGSSITHSFVIRNTGTAVLNISSVFMSGPHANQFVPLYSGASINPGCSETITLHFTPTTTGIKSAILNIVSNDLTVSNYDFAVTGDAMVVGPFYFNLHVLLEGYYTGSGTMTAAMYNQGSALPSNVTDYITVELHDVNPPYTLIESTITLLSTTGNAICTFFSNNSQNYMVIKHRNCIATWSASPINHTIAGAAYDFTTQASQAYGANMSQVEPGVWALYTGDFNQDENIDLVDLSILSNDILSYAFGMLATDVNGDANVDLLDEPIPTLNASNFVYSIHP